MDVLDAVAGDAEEACAVLRRSIAELCDADHRNDRAILAQWLSNTTPENVSAWIARPDASMLVAVERGAIVAVGMVTDAGHYPQLRLARREVSRREPNAPGCARNARGAEQCRLESTETAYRFHRANGSKKIRRVFGLSNGKKSASAEVLGASDRESRAGLNAPD